MPNIPNEPKKIKKMPMLITGLIAPLKGYHGFLIFSFASFLPVCGWLANE